MSLIALKDYLARRGSVTLQELVRELMIDPGFAESQLDFLVSRGKVSRLVQSPQALSCSSRGACTSCGSASSCGSKSAQEAPALTWYRWVG